MDADHFTETLLLGHSPDPDDAFMFYAMAKELIDLRGYKFEHILQDIQTLNERATRGELHVSAVSIHAYSQVLDKYALMPCGASMGDNYGPMIIADEDNDDLPMGFHVDEVTDWLEGKTVAIPGKMTSAYLSMQMCVGKDTGELYKTIVVPFDEIFDAVKSGKADAGLIIHEGQITYQNEGFAKIIDLGEWWMEEKGLPLPLGGNVVRKDLPEKVIRDVTEITRESVSYGLDNRRAGVEHSMAHARGLDTRLADEFIGMYVNDLTLDYGERGREAIREFLGDAHKAGLIPAPVELEFVELD
jgi:1,4-dihydroxy-6-naphthoate synthase